MYTAAHSFVVRFATTGYACLQLGSCLLCPVRDAIDVDAVVTGGHLDVRAGKTLVDQRTLVMVCRRHHHVVTVAPMQT